MSVGLIALLDDVIGLAKVAAASVDDVAAQAAKAGVKAAGVVIDDAAVTPRYVIGLSPARELPIIWRIALGSLRNKLLVLLPVALALSLFAPWAITPLLMIGGAYLCYEGVEKVYEALVPHGAHAHEAAVGSLALNPKTLEDQKVASAIKTDFILSAEIMAITLAAIPESGFWGQAAVLAVVGLGITVIVYGAVALIVKADDAGLALAAIPPDTPAASVLRPFGRGIVRGMPMFLLALSVVGTAAMIWVGGGIIVHGLEVYGATWLGHAIHDVAAAVGRLIPALSGVVEWIVSAIGAGLVGLAVGAALIPATGYVFAPAWGRLKALWYGRSSPAAGA
jgi:predicted DNA repair protein MutK